MFRRPSLPQNSDFQILESVQPCKPFNVQAIQDLNQHNS